MTGFTQTKYSKMPQGGSFRNERSYLRWKSWIWHVYVQSCFPIIFQYQPISLQYAWLSAEQPIRVWLSFMLLQHPLEFTIHKRITPICKKRFSFLYMWSVPPSILLSYVHSDWRLELEVHRLLIKLQDLLKLSVTTHIWSETSQYARDLVSCQAYICVEHSHRKFQY